MAVYFVYRCGYLGPTCLYRRRFDDATVLDWWRRHWVGIADEDAAIARAEQILGTDVAYFAAILMNIAEEKMPLPQSDEDIAHAIRSGYNNAVCFEEHCVQALTDDDEIDMAYYFFDDAFLAGQGDLAAYILREDWRLPDGEGKDGWFAQEHTRPAVEGLRGDGSACLYSAWLDQYGGEHLGDGFAPQHVLGVRVPELCRWLMGLPAAEVEDHIGYYFFELRNLLLSDDLADEDEERSFLKALHREPDDDLTWNVYADWCLERGVRPPGLRLLERALPRLRGGESGAARNLVQVGDHVVQLFAHVDGNDYDHWFFFDDLWGSAQPVLANALLRYANRWDMLSTGNESRWE